MPFESFKDSLEELRTCSIYTYWNANEIILTPCTAIQSEQHQRKFYKSWKESQSCCYKLTFLFRYNLVFHQHNLLWSLHNILARASNCRYRLDNISPISLPHALSITHLYFLIRFQRADIHICIHKINTEPRAFGPFVWNTLHTFPIATLAINYNPTFTFLIF